MDGAGTYPGPINAAAQFPAEHRLIPPLRTSASDLTQSSAADASDSNSPPSTSSSFQFATDTGANLNPHAQTKLVPSSVGDRPPLPQLQTAALPHQLQDVNSRPEMLLFTPLHSPPGARAGVQFTPGQKRTASGGVKFSVSPDRPFSAITTPGTGYPSRSMSTDSHCSRIAEISAQLRSRLSWAAATVENNRKSHPIGSNVTSPKARSSPNRIKSPNEFNGASPASSTVPNFNRPTVGRDFTTEILRIATEANKPTREATNNQLPTYAPRYHHRHNLSMGSIPSRYLSQHSTANGLHQVPRLAPPANIVPCKSAYVRRKSLNSTSPKKLPLSSLSRPSTDGPTVGTCGSYPIPATPPQPQLSFKAPSSATTSMLGKHCTPTQKTIMEQDAVETLVLMGSPENSGYYNDPRSRSHIKNTQGPLQFTSAPSSSDNIPASTSPAVLGVPFHFEPRRPNPPPTKRVSFVDHGEDQNCTYTSYSQPRLEQNAGDEIDRMLDEMGDSDNEQDYDWFAHMSEPRDNFTLTQQSDHWPNDQHNLPSSAGFNSGHDSR